MKKIVFTLLFVLVATNGYSQSKIKSSGNEPETGKVSLQISDNLRPRQNATFNNNYPAIVVDGMLWAIEDEDWKNIDTTKKAYSKEEIAFFLNCVNDGDAKIANKIAKEIKKIVVHKNDEFTEKLGECAKNGAIEITIKEKKSNRKE